MVSARKQRQVFDAAWVWRYTTCSFPKRCVGDNHVEDCASELARQDLIAAVDAARIPGD